MSTFDFNSPSPGMFPPAAAPAPAGPTVVQQQIDPTTGITWQQMSDGTVRQTAPNPPQMPQAAPPFGVPPAAGPFGTVQQPLTTPPYGAGAAPAVFQPQTQQQAPPWGGPSGQPPTTQQQPYGGQAIPEYVPLDEQIAGMRPPIGTFDVRLATCDGKRSGANNKDTGQPWHMVSLSLEVVSGRDVQGTDVAGREIRKTYLLDPRLNQKTGKWNSGGAAEIRDDLVKVGAPPFPAGFRFPINEVEAARIVAMGLGDKIFRIMTFETTRKKGNETKTNTEVKVVGPAGASVMPAAGAAFGGFAPPS